MISFVTYSSHLSSSSTTLIMSCLTNAVTNIIKPVSLTTFLTEGIEKVSDSD